MTKEEAINELNYIKESFAKCDLSYEAIDMAIKTLEDSEIIKCKDCKRFVSKVWLTGSGSVDVEGHCGWVKTEVMPHDFCSYAIRREDD